MEKKDKHQVLQYVHAACEEVIDSIKKAQNVRVHGDAWHAIMDYMNIEFGKAIGARTALHIAGQDVSEFDDLLEVVAVHVKAEDDRAAPFFEPDEA